MFFNFEASLNDATPAPAQQIPSPAARALSLSQREEEILLLSSQGLTDRQISVELGIRPGTINTHWSRIRLKLGASTRSEAVAILLKTQAEESVKQLTAERDQLLSRLKELEIQAGRAELALQALGAALQALPIILWAADETGRCLYLDGLPAKELRMLEGLEGSHSALLGALAKPEDLQKALEGRTVTTEGEFGDRRFETHLGPWRIKEQGPRRVVGLSIDATFAKAAQETVLSSLRLLTSIVEASPSVIHVHDIDERREIFVNRRVFQSLGYTPKEIYDLGTNITMSLVHPEDVPIVEGAKQAVLELADGEVLPVRYRMRRSNGEYAEIHDQVTVLSRTPSGRAKTVLGVAQVKLCHN
ncbi:MAG: PAS domain-containing protein [Fimbriimonadales bacterium]|nr:PAS domain-containing protein [Fimbriimonadales bacterium]